MGVIDYHLAELEIAKNKDDARHVLPTLYDSDQTILDIGCGIGQSFLALDCTDKTCIGLDVAEEVLQYGRTHYGDQIHFLRSPAEKLPLPSNTFNLVFSRVSLPYTNIPVALQEIRRVLQPDGRVWMTLHQRHMTVKNVTKSLKSLKLLRVVYFTYVLLNGYLLKYFGTVVPFINGRVESWQDTDKMKDLLIQNGFEVDVQQVGRHTVIQGRLRP